MQKKFKLIVGLGNPGKEYENTYHNVGALFVSFLMEATQEPVKKRTYAHGITHTAPDGVVFLFPTSYMNLSGAAVSEVLSYFPCSPEDILVAHDESDLPIGAHKLDFGRGSAGHKGVESVIHALHTTEFSRLRIGIRAPENCEKAEDIVLRRISASDRLLLQETFQNIMEKEGF